jgi:hypothetical protein
LLSGPKATEQGLVEWLYTAPRELVSADPLVASWRQGRQSWKDELSIALAQGPVAKVELTSDEELVHRGGAVDLRVKLVDANGKPRPEVVPELSAPGAELGEPKTIGPAEWELQLSAPLETEAKTLEVRATAFGPGGQGPAQLSVWRRGDELVAGVFDLAGWPVADQPLTLGARALRTGRDGRVVLGRVTESVELRHGEWPGLRRMIHVVGGKATPLDSPREAPVEAVTLRLGPPVPVNVRLQVRGAELSYWVEDPRGRLLPNRKVLIAFSTGERIDAVTTARRGVVRFPDPGAAVSVADVATGVTAVTEGAR